MLSLAIALPSNPILPVNARSLDKSLRKVSLEVKRTTHKHTESPKVTDHFGEIKKGAPPFFFSLPLPILPRSSQVPSPTGAFGAFSRRLLDSWTAGNVTSTVKSMPPNTRVLACSRRQMMAEWAIVVVVALIALSMPTSALSVGEERALTDLFESFPVLGSLPVPWSSNASDACGNDALPSWSGVQCDQMGHITQLYAKFQISFNFLAPDPSNLFPPQIAHRLKW